MRQSSGSRWRIPGRVRELVEGGWREGGREVGGRLEVGRKGGWREVGREVGGRLEGRPKEKYQDSIILDGGPNLVPVLRGPIN